MDKTNSGVTSIGNEARFGNGKGYVMDRTNNRMPSIGNEARMGNGKGYVN
jgi:hypothetical protein